MEDVIQEYNDYSAVQGNSFLVKVFFRMFTGLIITALVAYFTLRSGLFVYVLRTGSIVLLAIVEIILVLIFSFMFKKLSPTAVSALFYLYAAINGVTFSTIFIVYSISTISNAFFITSLLFGGLALYGYKTDKDISKIGTILSVALIVGVVATLFNLFMKNTLISIALDWIMLIIFCLYTAYDLNKIRRIQDELEYSDADEKITNKLYVYGAMELYLDFINLFLRILRILARSSRRR